MEVYKIWMSKYRDEENAMLFANLNDEEVIGIQKIFYLLKPSLGNSFIFSINRTVVSKSKSSIQQYRYRNIYPYVEGKNYGEGDKLFVIIRLNLFDTFKEYILFLNDISELNGCVFGMELFGVNPEETIMKIGKGNSKISPPIVNLKDRIVR